MGRIIAPVLIAILAVLAGCGGDEPKKLSPVKSAAYAKALAEFNRGGGLMEQYKYGEAAAAFEEVVRLAPDWVAARFNLGLAYLNMQGQEGEHEDPNRTRDVFDAILASDPGHLPAHFCLGLYLQHIGENTEALEHFHAVYRGDRDDPYVAYKYAETLLALGRDDEGAEMLEKVVALDGGFISAVYRLALQYQRTDRRQEAAKLFARFGELNAAELASGSFVVQKIYGTVGKYYRVLGPNNLPLAAPESTRRIVLSPDIIRLNARSASWSWAGGSVDLPGMAVGDIDNDGDLDLCLTASGEQGETVLWLNDGAGRFSQVQQLARQGVSPCFGDIDNDGDLDLWLGCTDSDRVFVNDGQGRFASGQFAGLAGPGTLTQCARLVDLDSDGDLDFLAFRLAEGGVPVLAGSVPAASSIYNSNGDDSYTDVAARLGLALATTPVAAVVYDDFDSDRDLDLVVFPAGDAPPVPWVNDRVGEFRILDEAATGLATRGVVGATSGDPDKDGDRDLLVFSERGLELWVNGGRFAFEIEQSFADQHGRLGGTGGQFADMDNDGDLDIVIADALRRDGSRGPAVLINDWPRQRFLNTAEIDPGNLLDAIRTEGDASCVVADFTGDGKCDILLAPMGSEPLLIVNATPGGHWIELDLRGTRERDRKARSNSWAIGARVEIKTGAVFQQFLVGGNSGPVAMSPARVHAGLGDNPKIDWLRIVWPDGVLQAELEVAADQVLEVTEVQRKTSSCPYLFAWNGSRFEFVADFGGVGGLGYFLAPGSYAPPDPTEYLRIPRLETRDGEYILQCLTPLEEVTYFDEAKLIAVDHPAGTEVYPHEMMAVGTAPPAPEVFCFEQSIDPVRAEDNRGVDVTDELLRIDRRCAGATRVGGHFMGLADDHFVELDFGDRLAKLAPGRRLILFLYGWVEYGYSSTNYAAAQAGKSAKAPSIHVLRDGAWTEVFHEVGYPAGIQHMMTLDVTGKIRSGDRHIRISSNMELYWDRVFLAEHLDDAGLTLSEAPARSADLHFRGYPREYSPDGRHPLLSDYDNIDTATSWKLMAGQYTRYGAVTELVGEADDCYVIMQHGDELTLRFPADAFGPVPEGQRRTFILKTDSFCKDMDLYTGYPDTVEPLPFHAMSGYPYGPNEHYPDNEKTRAYRRQFNTRLVRTR
ncbi:MAG: FG-GAP-like repeat-containing protein [Candidatus Krumholzibacteria bacterium]